MSSARSISLGIVATTLAALAAGAADVGASASQQRAAPAAAAAACRAQRLVAWLNTKGSGAAGSTYYRVELTNLSSRRCTLAGYPRVAAVNLVRHQLGDASSRFVSRVRTVTLAPGATGSFVLQVVDVANFAASACRPVTAAGLRVALPHQPKRKLVPFPFRACSRRGPAYLWAQAVVGHA